MQWAQYSTLYQGILDQLPLIMIRGEVIYLECMYSILEGLQQWWMFYDDPLQDVLRDLDALTVQYMKRKV